MFGQRAFDPIGMALMGFGIVMLAALTLAF
jgi:hypothetical protein